MNFPSAVWISVDSSMTWVAVQTSTGFFLTAAVATLSRRTVNILTDQSGEEGLDTLSLGLRHGYLDHGQERIVLRSFKGQHHRLDTSAAIVFVSKLAVFGL